MSIRSLAGRICQALFFPQACVLCARPVLNGDLSPLCPPCLAALKPLKRPICLLCGVPLPGSLTDRDERCSECCQLQRPYDLARAFGSYEGALKAVIRKFKFEGHQRLAYPLAGLLGSCCQQMVAAEAPEWILPVPLHARRKIERGFDQTLSLGRLLSRRLHIPVFGGLSRVRPTTPQSGLPLEQRKKNVQGAFSLSRAECLTNTSVLILDDVLTTGTTVAEIARLIREQSQVNSILVLTVARVPLLHGRMW